MPLAKDITERQRLALVGALALATGIVGTIALDSDPEVRKVQLEQLGDAVAKGSAVVESDILKPDEYHRAMAEVRAADPDAVDLLTGPVDPGASVETEVVIPSGRQFAEVELVGPSAGAFTIASIVYQPRDEGVLVRVTATNNSRTRLRLIALAHMEPVP
jgi:hypothetical protein